jgi:hypothetical protein
MAEFLETARNFENSESGVEKMDVLITEMGRKAEPHGVSNMKEQLRLHRDNRVDFEGKFDRKSDDRLNFGRNTQLLLHL